MMKQLQIRQRHSYAVVRGPSGYANGPADCVAALGADPDVSKHEEFSIKIEELCIEIEDCCIKK